MLIIMIISSSVPPNMTMHIAPFITLGFPNATVNGDVMLGILEDEQRKN